MENTNPDWTNLPKDLILSITKHLTRSETLVLRAVCNKLRHTIPSPQEASSPNVTLSIPSPVSSEICHFDELSLKQSTFYAIQPLREMSLTPKTTNMWLVNVEEAKSGHVRVKDPLTGSRLPGLNNLPPSLNLLDHRVKEIAVAYDLGLVGDRKRKDPEVEYGERRAYFVQKVAVSPCFDDKDNRFAIMAIYSMKKLGIWRKGDTNWTEIAVGDGEVYLEDVAYYNGKFYALNKTGVTVSVDPESLNATEVVAAEQKFNGSGFKYLTKTNQDLLLVVKQIFCEDFEEEEISNGEYFYPVRVNVFKLDEEENQWVRVIDGLKDTALFLDNDCSFTISVKEFPACKENCVYFSDTMFINSYQKFPGWYAGIYDMNNGTVGPLAAFPNYSKIFWPPPSWLNEIGNGNKTDTSSQTAQKF